MDTSYRGTSRWGPHCRQLMSPGTWESLLMTGGLGWGRAGWEEAHMAVMVSLWKVTKAMPRGFSFTFSLSRW